MSRSNQPYSVGTVSDRPSAETSFPYLRISLLSTSVIRGRAMLVPTMNGICFAHRGISYIGSGRSKPLPYKWVRATPALNSSLLTLNSSLLTQIAPALFSILAGSLLTAPSGSLSSQQRSQNPATAYRKRRPPSSR